MSQSKDVNQKSLENTKKPSLDSTTLPSTYSGNSKEFTSIKKNSEYPGATKANYQPQYQQS